ncbi:hypothetical protein BDV06DRAFT_186353 [Aspergillus oleicola]
MITWRPSFITDCRGPYCSKEAVAMLSDVFQNSAIVFYCFGKADMCFEGCVGLAKCSEVDRDPSRTLCEIRLLVKLGRVSSHKRFFSDAVSRQQISDQPGAARGILSASRGQRTTSCPFRPRWFHIKELPIQRQSGGVVSRSTDVDASRFLPWA